MAAIPPMDRVTDSTGRVILTHGPENCTGACPIHDPSDHEYRDLPLRWDPYAFCFFRIKEDGSEVIDPDSLDHLRRTFNGARCQYCNTWMRSRHRHDYVRCKCGACSVDGGPVYKRRGGVPIEVTYDEWMQRYGPG